jgi:5-formyltetrahydrofolate cyclo-ligase
MTDVIHQSKTEIRARMKALLASMTPELRHAASVAACGRVAALEPLAHANIVMMYMPLSTEVDVTPAVLQAFRRGQTLCVPKVDWRRKDMAAVEITSLDDRVLDTDEHGLRSPRDGRLIMPNSIDAVVVPGLAFDPQGCRLGRGGGYFDRFLARLRPTATTIGLVFDQQIIDKVPVATCDASVDIIVSDRRVMIVKPARSRT